MASNELAAHGALQPPAIAKLSDNLSKLLGGLIVEGGAGSGEQWVVFKTDGIANAAEYAGIAAEAGANGQAVGEGQFWDTWDKSRPLRGRKLFLIKASLHLTLF